MFDLVEHAIDGEALRRDLLSAAAGGLVIFEGLVRDHNEGRAVSALEYEIYTAMARKEAARIFAEAHEKFDVIALRGAHRSGFLNIGEMAVWVGASARHRAEAFQACRFLIDEIKSRLPVWKKEHYLEGPAEWVDCQGCYHHHGPDFTSEQFYSRQLRLPDFGAAEQQRLREARVLVVGAGGLGCPALSALAGAGVGHLTVCDGDRLAVSNLHRQTLYRHEDIGQDKARLAARQLAALNPLIEVRAVTEHLDLMNAAELVAAHDVVLDCTDNFSAKFLLHDGCYLERKILVQASIYQYEGQLQVFDFRGGSSAGCLRCAWPEIPAADCVGSCAEVGVLGAVPAVLGSLQAMETIKVITGRSSPALAATVLVDLLTLRTSPIKRPRLDDCPLCGDDPRIESLTDEDYAPRQDWEVSLSDFQAQHPGGRIVDIRAPAVQQTPSKLTVTWESAPDADAAELAAMAQDADVLLVCRVGVRTRSLVSALRAAGHDGFWSLWRGIDGL
jgi:adenylyltransferase/sulfurtransferase